MTIFDWRDLMASDPETRATVHPERRRVRAAELTEVQREVLKLANQGFPAVHLATLYGLSEAEVIALIHGTDDTERNK